MADPYSVEARRRLNLAKQGKIAAVNEPKYEAMMKKLKDEGWKPSKTTTTSGLASGRKQPPRSGTPKAGTLGEEPEKPSRKREVSRNMLYSLCV